MSFIYDSQGGAYIKADCIEIAAETQKKLVKDILDENFDKEAWKQELIRLKDVVYSNRLEQKYLVKVVAITKNPSEYLGDVIDGKTGKPKIKKDGSIQKKSIPAHITIALKMISDGEMVDPGQKIEYVVLDTHPKIKAITLKEYEEIKTYSHDYYYKRIITPIIEILSAVYPNDLYTFFRECLPYSDRQITKLIEELEEEDEDIDEGIL